MNAIRTFALAFVVALGFSAGSAEAANVFAGVVRNKSNITVTYQYRHKTITKNAWVTVTLQPGGEAVYSLKSPALLNGSQVEIRFDKTLKDMTVVYQYTTLAMWGCNSPKDGLFQGFVIVNSGKDLFLHR